jgi:hypothetical protein
VNFIQRGEITRQKLYQGDCFLLSASDTSNAFVHDVLQIIKETYQTENITGLHSMKNEVLMGKLSTIRKYLRQNPLILEYQSALLKELNWDPVEFLIDRPRLRMVTPQMHTINAARPAFYAHRDTWYANPEEQINMWIPLDRYQEQETFTFYGSYFRQAIENDSKNFDYQLWKKEIGFQAINTKSSIYPRALKNLPTAEDTFSCQKGQRLLFSAQHLHRTLENLGNRTRLSIDFRVVNKVDFEKKYGPENQDNSCRGSVLDEYTVGRKF